MHANLTPIQVAHAIAAWSYNVPPVEKYKAAYGIDPESNVAHFLEKFAHTAGFANFGKLWGALDSGHQRELIAHILEAYGEEARAIYPSTEDLLQRAVQAAAGYKNIEDFAVGEQLDFIAYTYFLRCSDCDEVIESFVHPGAWTARGYTCEACASKRSQV